MARVSRATSATSSKTRAEAREAIRNSMATQVSEYSITTLRSEQEQEEGVTCWEWCLNGLQTLFNFTIASCRCFSCFLKRSGHHQRLESSSSMEDVEMAEIKEKLKFHFMNPFQKWRYPKRRRFPWKLLVQLASIILVTAQLIFFANTKFALTDFITQNQATFTKLFVKNAQEPDNDDPLPSPIANLYTHDELQDQVNHTIEQYFALDTLALGTYGYSWETDGEKTAPCIDLVITQYKSAKIDPAMKQFNVSEGTGKTSQRLRSDRDYNLDWTKINKELSQTIQISLQFNITAILIHTSNSIHTAECVQFRLEFVIKNNFASGSMPVTLIVNQDIMKCNGDNSSRPLKSENVVLSSTATTALDSVVMVFAFISIFLCLRSLITSWRLSREVYAFFRKKFGYRLKFHQILPLYNMWFLGIIISNLFVVVGCILKLLIAYNVFTSIEVVDLTSIVVGLAAFGQWCGLLRFLSYLDKYNMLLITLRLSLPSVFRFVICTGILYIAFLLCGWLVLGPYHPKFRDPFVTSECLFSLINGDDMFATYKGMSSASQAAYVFSKVYLYVFIALFIYVVLSVFISLISDTYETLHEHWYERSKGLLVDFATGQLAQPHYHSGTVGHTHHHTHTDTEILHDDKTNEEDYEYLREASNRFGPAVGENRPLIINGGPELRVRLAEGDARPRSRSTGHHIDNPQVYVRPYSPDRTEGRGSDV